MTKEQIKEQTKERIKEAYIDLCEKNMQEDISVSDICKYADVSRSTFYRFFSDKDNVLKVIEQEYIDEMNRMIVSSWKNITYDDYLKDPHAFDDELRRFWEFHFRTKKTCRLLLSENGDPYFTYLFYSFLEETYRNTLKTGNKTFGPYEDLIIRFQVNGILSLVFYLMGQDDVSSDIYPVLTRLFINLPLDNFVA